MQKADHALMRAERRAVDAERNFFVAFAVRELEIESLGDGKIHLIRHQGEFSANRTPDLHIDFWTVECRLILGFHIRHIAICSLRDGPSLPS